MFDYMFHLFSPGKNSYTVHPGSFLASSELFLRAIWEAVSWAIVLIKVPKQNKRCNFRLYVFLQSSSKKSSCNTHPKRKPQDSSCHVLRLEYTNLACSSLVIHKLFSEARLPRFKSQFCHLGQNNVPSPSLTILSMWLNPFFFCLTFLIWIKITLLPTS